MTKSFFPTSGTRTHWLSKDGRLTHVDDLALPHLANILIQLWDAASKEVLKTASQRSPGLLESDTYLFLMDNCFTFNKLSQRAYKPYTAHHLCSKYGKPTEICYQLAGNGRKPAVKAEAQGGGKSEPLIPIEFKHPAMGIDSFHTATALIIHTGMIPKQDSEILIHHIKSITKK